MGDRPGPGPTRGRRSGTHHPRPLHGRERHDFLRAATHAQEQDDLDADIDSYLHDGGLPPRPRGYRWFLTLPTGHTEGDLWRVLNGGLAESARTGHPSDTLLVMREILAQLYPQT